MKKVLLFSSLILFSILFSSFVQAGTVRVKGYYRKDGTYVQPHTRTAPDGIKWNNKSY
ncbi:MAG: hypothetical protein IKL90_01765 [Alphaproteobacteria bacterium]|nr:hypothetical protein [Alphaproteobacteria bacterium]